MFFLKDLSLNLTLHPSYFGPQMKRYLRDRLLTDVEGTCSGQFGFIVTVLDSMTIEVGKGKILPTSGYAEFQVKYRAVVWRPFKGEVVDGIVSKVERIGIFVDVGPLEVFIAVQTLPNELTYNPSNNPPAFMSEDQLITKGSKIRLKITAVRSDVNHIVALGSINEDYLGAL
ncbi:hypothetical protein PACTADRAFT_52147 [Pachysolen tannophilus NRRL Y-2460]|uniref:DNA-directed RNA polymerase subunit n=1 Tax=Pachysolen tannophilus NRRL Y-2460 TaxID=669874 RepID=A0A1E4TMW3_PACTA|nr:hypothetical protein PACTADRAFT_52147 [Pachysolen tannophilus NRRL Y-2460]